MNILDRCISFFSPVVALKRVQARKLIAFSDSSYISSSSLKRSLINWFPALKSANTELSENERTTLTARSWDAYRNQELARGAINRIKTNVVGVGVKLIPDIDSGFLGLDDDQEEQLEAAIKREWELFANTKNVDIERNSNFDECQAIFLINELVSGESFVNTPILQRVGDLYGLKIQFIDPARVCNPNRQLDKKGLIKGVELDEYGAPIAYFILRAHPADMLIKPAESLIWDRVQVFGDYTGRRRVLHAFDKDQAEQTRGISYLAPILEPLKQLKRYCEAEIMAAVISSMLTIFIENEGTEPLPNDENTDLFQGNMMEFGAGSILEILPGRKINVVNPQRPNTQYEPFVFSVMRQIGAALELPLDEILMRFDSSYSAARAAMLQAWRFYRMRRKFLVDNFCQPIYSLWFDEAVSRNVLPYVKNYSDPRRRAAYQGSSWIGQGRGAIDELKEAQAARERIEIGVSSIPIEAAELKGEYWETIAKQQGKALKKLHEKGVVLSGKNGDSPENNEEIEIFEGTRDAF